MGLAPSRPFEQVLGGRLGASTLRGVAHAILGATMAAPLRGTALRLSKISILALWAWGIVSVLADPTMGGWVTAGRWVAAGLLVAHALELAVYVPRLRKAGEQVGAHIGPLMLYGGVHFFSLDVASGSGSD